MKTQPKFFLWAALAASLLAAPLQAQEQNDVDSTGLAGDHFSLEAALDLFKQSSSLEDFEKRLNEEDNPANNLDLNEDGQIDYIRVVDRMDGDVHAIVLQAPVSEAESQDVAVIELEKTGAESAVLQILGDEDVFGEQVIAEPVGEEGVESPKGRGGPAVHLAPDAIIVNVWLWPSVRYMYRPAYVVYVSPWRWGLYPTWWRPFRPRPWGLYHARIRPYRAHYHVVTTHRVVRAHRAYTPHRTHSKVVRTRTTTKVTATGPRGGKVSKTKTSTTVQGKHGKVKKEKTTTTAQGRNGGKVQKQKSTTKVKGGGNRRGRN
ncbi:MAG: hypothetical protein IPL27_21400 [Lewinellaceae bacterium]|nr:hypothetical protein [Lewinellaceae bacterium]